MEENRNQVGNRHIGRKLTTARPVKLNEGERNRHRFVRSEEGRKEGRKGKLHPRFDPFNIPILNFDSTLYISLIDYRDQES